MGKTTIFALVSLAALIFVSAEDVPKTTTESPQLAVSTWCGQESDEQDDHPVKKSESDLMELKAKKFLEDYEERQIAECRKVNVADWAFVSNITDENKDNAHQASLAHAKFKKDLWKQVIAFPWKTFKDPSLHRQFKFLSDLGTAALPEDKLEQYNTLRNSMESIFSKAKVCRFDNPDKCDLSLKPELSNILRTSRNYEELEHIWLKFRDATGYQMRDMYPKYVELLNEAARINGFKDGSEAWQAPYESETFKDDIYKLWEQIRPLYEQLHAYVRRQLVKQYGSSKVSREGALPAHLLGNMWAQQWTNILPFTTPYPEKPSLDVSEAMVEQNYTVFDMFKESEKFLVSVNLTEMTPEFWANSIIEEPTYRDNACYTAAWDFCDGRDFRIRQWTEVNMEDLITVHHEMGHVAYYMQYKDQPFTFRKGANPGFHEAVADILALSVSTPKHLKEIGLLKNAEDDQELNINYLYSQALETVAFMPFALTLDQFRWDIFSGQIKPEEYNCHWWKLRYQHQGVRPPITRKSTDFDAGSKYHIPASVPYIRYFVSHVLQYQFHKALCIEAGQYDPTDPTKSLHKCDIYRNKVAGTKLGNMLKLGSSVPWPEALEQVTGQKVMDASDLVEYFQPLYEWLRAENAKTGESLGWKESDQPRCVSV